MDYVPTNPPTPQISTTTPTGGASDGPQTGHFCSPGFSGLANRCVHDIVRFRHQFLDWRYHRSKHPVPCFLRTIVLQSFAFGLSVDRSSRSSSSTSAKFFLQQCATILAGNQKFSGNKYRSNQCQHRSGNHGVAMPGPRSTIPECTRNDPRQFQFRHQKKQCHRCIGV